jgi:hypothetical protein
MLSPHECSVGYISDAVGLTLILPRGGYENSFIVVATAESKFAIVLGGEHRFRSFECSNNMSWAGLVIPNVAIEIDETSIVNAGPGSAPLGALVRAGTTLAIATKSDDRMGNHTVPVLTGLTPCRDDLAAGFKRWRVVIGEEQSKRELKMIEVA